MTQEPPPNVFSIPVGVPFLPALADAALSGRLVPDFEQRGDPMALAAATIYVPTRRAARELRALFVERSASASTILPQIRPLGEFDADDALFDPQSAAALDLAPPIPAIDRLLHLAPLVRLWKRRLPAHVAAMFAEEITVPASSADAVWLARDLATLMDEIETEGSGWSELAGLAPGTLAGWWQVTLEFLSIVTEHWPAFLQSRGLSSPAAHRNALLRLEAERLRKRPPAGLVIAAGSTGSIAATAELLSVIARMPRGAVVLPGLDRLADERQWEYLAVEAPLPALLGHPQFGLARLLRHIGLPRRDVVEIGEPAHALALRARLVSESLRPADTTDEWAARRALFSAGEIETALSGVTLVEAARERDEAAAIALALRLAVATPGRTAALVTGDRELARRVSAELQRFGVRADDSGGTPLQRTSPAMLLALMLQAALAPGDPVPILGLLKHPLLSLGLDRQVVRHAAGTVELVALRGGTGRPDAAALASLFGNRLSETAAGGRTPFWLSRLSKTRIDEARDLAVRIGASLQPLAALRGVPSVQLADILRQTVVCLENLGRGPDGALTSLYAGDAGQALAEFLRGLVASTAPFECDAAEWPEVMAALLSSEVVKPAHGAERRIAIWGALEARLQSVDTLVVGGLNEGTWPRKAEADRFMSRMMKSGLGVDPPERRIGQAAHDFVMAAGTGNVVFTRSARSGEAPTVASRWLQRLAAFAGPEDIARAKARGDLLLSWARELDKDAPVRFVKRPQPKPPVDLRPTHFSVTEIETLRRDPYAIYARRILRLSPLDPLLRDPGAAERGSLFHAILHRFTEAGVDPRDALAEAALLEAARQCFAEAALPPDVQAIWWPRFVRLAGEIVAWERSRAASVLERRSEARASSLTVGASGVTLSGYADRVDLLPAGMADILDYKTGSSPSRGQAHTLLSPQLPLEGALLKRGAFRDIGPLSPADLAFVRLKANGVVEHESILEHNRSIKSATALSEEAWGRLEKLLLHYANADTGYLSRAVPFREGETDGDYDHLARVLEWSAGGDGPDDAAAE